MDAENCRLRRVDDRRREQGSEHTAVGNRECAAGQLFKRQLAVFGALRKVSNLEFDLCKGHLVRIS